MAKKNLLPSFNNPRRRIRKPSKTKRYLGNNYSELLRIEQQGPRNREERRALEKYYRRSGKGKYYKPAGMSTSKGALKSTEATLSEATSAYKSNKLKNLRTAESRNEVEIKNLTNEIELSNKRAARARDFFNEEKKIKAEFTTSAEEIEKARRYRDESIGNQIYEQVEAIYAQERQDELEDKYAAEQIRDLARRDEAEVELFPESSPSEIKAARLNEALDIATELQKDFKYGNGKYTQYLEPLLKRLDELGYDYDLKQFEGKNFLYQNVRFKELPDDARVNQLVDKILSLNYSSYENYQNMLEENAQAAGITGVENFAVLASVMESSAAWQIAKKNAPDSEQIKTNWVRLYDIAEEAYTEGLLDLFITEVIAHPDDYTLDKAEELITNALKGD